MKRRIFDFPFFLGAASSVLLAPEDVFEAVAEIVGAVVEVVVVVEEGLFKVKEAAMAWAICSSSVRAAIGEAGGGVRIGRSAGIYSVRNWKFYCKILEMQCTKCGNGQKIFTLCPQLHQLTSHHITPWPTPARSPSEEKFKFC